MNFAKKITLFLGIMISIEAYPETNPSHSISFQANIDQIISEFEKHKVSNLIEAISLFSDKYFKKENYALIFDSLSPQTSSEAAPRVLLFGKGKKLRIGFNHHSKHGQDLEVIQWRETTSTWEFHEIKFLNRGYEISKVNPNRCIHCHDDYKPKFGSHFVKSLQGSNKAKLNISPFANKIKTDSIYIRFENPPTKL